MIAEYARKPYDPALWLDIPTERARHRREERLERCRPLASTVSELLEMMTSDETLDPFSLDGLSAFIENDQPSCLDECVGSEDPDLERVEAQIAWHQMVDELEPRLRRVIELRYYEDLPQIECARRLGVSQTLVSRLERCALALLRGQAATA